MRSLGLCGPEQRSWGEPLWQMQLLTASRGVVLSPADSDRVWGNGTELRERGRLGVRTDFSPEGGWAWNGLHRAEVTAPGCRSSSSVWTTLSEIRLSGWFCAMPEVGLHDPSGCSRSRYSMNHINNLGKTEIKKKEKCWKKYFIIIIIIICERSTQICPFTILSCASQIVLLNFSRKDFYQDI